jgi:hypothetical protein
MASDFSVTWQCLSKRTIGFLLWIKLHALIWLGFSPPSFDTWPRFEPGSPKWHTGALPTTPRAYSYNLKNLHCSQEEEAEDADEGKQDSDHKDDDDDEEEEEEKVKKSGKKKDQV